MKEKIVIIGAGPSGLTAGLELIRRGYEVTILEETGSAGGISRTIHHNDQRIDIGGHRFFSKDDRVMKWWFGILPVQGAPAMDDKALGRKARTSEHGPDPDNEDDVFLIRHRISRIYYRNKFYDYPVSVRPQTFINMGLGTSLSAGLSYIASCIHRLPEDSLENFYINRFGRKLYSMFFEGYTEKVWGRHPSEISADWGSQRVKGLSLSALLKNVLYKIVPSKNHEVETSLIEEFYYPKYGPGQLWENAAARFCDAGGRIYYDKKAVSLECDGNLIRRVKASDGSCYECDELFSSMPVCQLVGAFADAPQYIQDISKGLPYRDFVTVGLLVDRLAIRNETSIPTLGDIVPDCWIYVQDMEVKLGRIQIFNNWSPYMLKDPEHTVWIGLEYFCQENDDFWNMEEDRCISHAVRELQKIGILDNNVSIMDSCRIKVRKAYPAYFDTYKDIDKVISFLDSYNNLYCIGRNGQHRYNNMDHSMLTAFTAVDCMEGRKTKAELWNVNTEKEYHEEKRV